MIGAPALPTRCPKCRGRAIRVTTYSDAGGVQFYIECPAPELGGPDHTSTIELPVS